MAVDLVGSAKKELKSRMKRERYVTCNYAYIILSYGVHICKLIVIYVSKKMIYEGVYFFVLFRFQV